jgi:hypoxanthine phosphoribosyltransferase
LTPSLIPGILQEKSGVFFAAELAKRLTVPVTIDFMSVSSYGSGTISSGVVRMVKDLDEPIEDLDVLVVEDVIDSGRTLKYLLDNLGTRKPASLRLCTLLDKPTRRVTDIKVDYTGFRIPDDFVVGDLVHDTQIALEQTCAASSSGRHSRCQTATWPASSSSVSCRPSATWRSQRFPEMEGTRAAYADNGLRR